MKPFNRFGLVALLFALTLGASTDTWAAKKKRGTKKVKDSPAPALEIYSATEADGEPGTEMRSARITTASMTTPAPVAPKPLKKKKPVSFDTVPVEQADAIIRRLDLVYQLIHDYGRAYDYRTLTVRQLEAIVKELEEEQVEVPPPPADDKD